MSTVFLEYRCQHCVTGQEYSQYHHGNLHIQLPATQSSEYLTFRHLWNETLQLRKQVQIILHDQESTVDGKAPQYSEILWAWSSQIFLHQIRPTWKLLTALSRNVTVTCLARYCCTSNNWQDEALSCRRTHFLATYISKMFQVTCLLQTGKHLFLPLLVDWSTLRHKKVVYNAPSLEQIFCHLLFQVMLMELHESQQEWWFSH
jgi:hypothetical protein